MKPSYHSTSILKGQEHQQGQPDLQKDQQANYQDQSRFKTSKISHIRIGYPMRKNIQNNPVYYTRNVIFGKWETEQNTSEYLDVFKFYVSTQAKDTSSRYNRSHLL